MESLVAGEIEEWKGPNSERVKEVNGEIIDRGFTIYNIELVLTNGGKVNVEETESSKMADLGDEVLVYYDDGNGKEIGIGKITLHRIEKEERVPQLMKDHVYEASMGYGIALRMLNLYSDYASKQ